MAKKEWTAEEREAYSIAAKERHAAKRAAEAAKVAPEEPPAVMPSVGEDWREAAAVVEPGDEIAASEPPADDPFGQFLASQDEETRSILSDVELRVIFEVETKKALEAKREATKKLVAARAARAARVDAGLISPADAAQGAWQRKMNEKVTYTPKIPQDANGHAIDVGYRVNGNIVYDGQPIVCTRAEALSLREMEWRAMNHEMDFEGRGRLSQQRQMSAQSLAAKL